MIGPSQVRKTAHLLAMATVRWCASFAGQLGPKGLERLAREIVGGVYPTLDQRLEAAERLEVRGWGKPKQDVVIDDTGGGGGFKLVYRRWPVGVDPAAEPPPGERIITGTAKALPPSSTNGTTGT